jgi:hypothetical protein
MDFELNDQQKMVRQLVRDFLVSKVATYNYSYLTSTW